MESMSSYSARQGAHMKISSSIYTGHVNGRLDATEQCGVTGVRGQAARAAASIRTQADVQPRALGYIVFLTVLQRTATSVR